MRISIDAPKENNGRFRLNLPVPLWICRFGFIWKHLPKESQQFAPIASEVVKALKDYKKENGSWNLVEVQTADNETQVLVRV